MVTVVIERPPPAAVKPRTRCPHGRSWNTALAMWDAIILGTDRSIKGYCGCCRAPICTLGKGTCTRCFDGPERLGRKLI